MEDVKLQYIGLFFNEYVKNELKFRFNKLCSDKFNDKIDLSKKHKEYFDHVTLMFKTQFDKNKVIYEELLTGVEVLSLYKIEIDAIGYNDKCVAFRVVKSKFMKRYCMNDTPHITCIVYDGHKPVNSNEITEWVKIPKIKVFGYIGAYYSH